MILPKNWYRMIRNRAHRDKHGRTGPGEAKQTRNSLSDGLALRAQEETYGWFRSQVGTPDSPDSTGISESPETRCELRVLKIPGEHTGGGGGGRDSPGGILGESP